MLNKFQNDAVSDTTKDDSSNEAGYIIINFILKNSPNQSGIRILRLLTSDLISLKNYRTNKV
ncbi:MAG: hypothetical protein J7502_13705, partial [Flavisolibacter sp.]|nr:hypothetical protein [Flavisolibacter sp.]